MVFLCPIIMDLEDLPFKIGMQYENWEFDLEPVEFAEYYDKYIYIKSDFSELLGFSVVASYLYFKLDILFKIEIFFKIDSALTYHLLAQKLRESFNEGSKVSIVNNKLFEQFWLYKGAKFYLRNYQKQKLISLIIK